MAVKRRKLAVKGEHRDSQSCALGPVCTWNIALVVPTCYKEFAGNISGKRNGDKNCMDWFRADICHINSVKDLPITIFQWWTNKVWKGKLGLGFNIYIINWYYILVYPQSLLFFVCQREHNAKDANMWGVLVVIYSKPRPGLNPAFNSRSFCNTGNISKNKQFSVTASPALFNALFNWDWL